jgi:hypothetical protein
MAGWCDVISMFLMRWQWDDCVCDNENRWIGGARYLVIIYYTIDILNPNQV